MTFQVGQVVKLKDYDFLELAKSHKDEYAEIISISSAGHQLRWIKDYEKITITGDKIKKVETLNLKDVAKDLKVGDIIATNADRSNTYDGGWYFGEVGEIVEKEGKRRLYIWNNIADGSKGTKKVKKWKFSFMIRSNNDMAQIIVIDNAVKERQCFKCKEKLETDEGREGADEELYCDDCFSDLFCICDKCEDVIWSDDSFSPESGDSIYCDYCYRVLYFHCEACDCEVHRDYSSIGSDDCSYCSDCWQERFGGCDGCGNTFRQEDLRWSDENEEYYCEDCRGESRNVHDYGYKPEAEFNKLEWEKHLFMGIELEVQREEEIGEYADKFIKFLNKEGKEKYFYLKHDNSIGDDGFEIVSHPFTLQYAHKNIGFCKILKWLQDHEFKSEESGECGLHIHLDKKFFEELDIAKLRLFFKKNGNKITILSRREDKQIRSYCKFEDISDKDIIRGSSQSGRYWAVNCEHSSRETVEIRIFRGTLDVKRFIAILQFVDAIANFVKKIGITSLLIGEKLYYENSWKLFIDWAKEQNIYGTMLSYFAEEKLCV